MKSKMLTMNKEDKIRQIEINNKLERRKYSPLIAEIYPNVLEITMDLKFDYPNAFSIHKSHITPKYTPTDKAYFEISCINKDCIFSDLDIELDYVVGNAISQKLELCEGHNTCKGYNTYNCYERKQGTCMTGLDYEIRIKYKNTL